MTPSTPRRVQLTRDQRRDIRTLRSTGMSYAQVVEHFLIVYNTIITLRQVNYACLAGRPSLMWPERVQVLIDFIRSSRLARQMSYLALALHFHTWNVSEYTIRHVLRKAGFRRYVARSKPKISPKNRRDRLQ